MIKAWIAIDKFLETVGQKKAQKGFAVAAISALILQFFPDFPQEAFTRLIQLLVELVTLLGSIWATLGIVHQWVKDNILKQGIIPPSLEKRAELLGKPVIIDPPKRMP